MNARYLAGALATIVTLTVTALAAPYTWNSATGSNWDDTSATGWNTGGAYPNAQDDTATFSQDIAANQTITINAADAKAAALTLDDTSPNYGWVLSGGNPLTFDSSSGTATVNVNGSGGYDANTHRISAPIVTGNALDIILGAAGRLRLSGGNSGATGGMSISGGGSGGFVLFDSAASLGGAGNTITVASGAQAGIGFSGLTQADLNRFAGSSGLLAFSSLLDHGWGYFISTPASPAPNLDLTGFNEYFRIGACDELRGRQFHDHLGHFHAAVRHVPVRWRRRPAHRQFRAGRRRGHPGR